MQVWVAMRCGEDEKTGVPIFRELLGVFLSEEKARAACVFPNDGFGSVEADATLPEELTEWPGWRYPCSGADGGRER